MSQQPHTQLPSNEAKIQLAKLAIENNQIQSIREAAKAYNVSYTTLHRRLNGIASRSDCAPNSKKLTNSEEQAIIIHALDVDARGFQLNYDLLRGLANKLLADRGAPHVGIKWPINFIQRVDALKIRVNRKYDYQRALNEDPGIINAWFRLVYNVKAKYGILDDDTYNFDEAGFQIGVISTRLVITGTERRTAPKSLQPGNTEWATSIVAANAIGWAIPPFFILKGKQHYNTWYQAIEDRPEWVLSVSDKGWTSLEHGFEWLKHFNRYTESRTVGAYRLLIMDGHDSHNTTEFLDFCKDHKIITLCMPPHSSHLLQPLDVGCFALLKRAYSREIEDFIRCRINHITKEDFLPAFKAAFDKAITADNIRGAFRGAGLVPFNPETVLSKLDVRLRTPSPGLPETPQWASQTPRNIAEIGSQTAYVRERLQRHQNSSPTSLFKSFASLEKGVQMIAHGASIMEVEIGRLRKANEALSKRKQRKKKVLKGFISKSIADGLQLVAQRQGQDIIDQTNTTDNGAVRRQRRCGRCREPGHRIETCPQPQLATPENIDPSLICN
jgi:hypothetical protein